MYVRLFPSGQIFGSSGPAAAWVAGSRGSLGSGGRLAADLFCSFILVHPLKSAVEAVCFRLFFLRRADGCEGCGLDGRGGGRGPRGGGRGGVGELPCPCRFAANGRERCSIV